MTDVAHTVSRNRREFLRIAAGMCALPAASARAAVRKRKAVVVTFGGGARDDETFTPEGQANIPHLLHELAPRSTFFSQVINRGILGHYVATASLATGVYESFNNFASVPPDHPTVFEYFRRDLRRPAFDAWVVAPSNGFHRIGESGHRAYGRGLGAGVILPKRLLAAARASGAAGTGYEHLLRDNYETPFVAPESSGSEAELRQIADILKISAGDFLAHARSLRSADELSIYIARQLMRQLAPSLLWITLHDIDVAHTGAYSLYLEAIQRADRLCAELWSHIERDPEYNGRTTLFILPDFGRDSDTDGGGNGFQHHRTGDALSRTTWMLTLGAGVRENTVVDRAIDSTDLVPTLGALFGFTPRFAQGHVLSELT